MKLALLKGNRFNPWHLRAFTQLGEDVSVTAFRAESEVQEYFADRGDGTQEFDVETIQFEHQVGMGKVLRPIRERLGGVQSRILPFADRLEGYDLIQSWELFTDWTEQALDAKRRYGIPVSLMMWDNIAYNHETSPELIARKERAIREADRFIVHTERSRRVLEMEGADASTIELIAPGVDETHFASGASNRVQFGLADDEFVMLFVGWMLPRKGLEFLILALKNLVDDPELKDSKFRLAIVASGPGRDRIEALARRAGVEDRVTFLGTFPYDEMPEVYRSADCFVLPSIATTEWQEQFGMSLIEAMACGVPVVTTRSGAIPEIAGDAARLCQANDFLSLYEALRELVLDESQRRELSKAGRARVEVKFRLNDYANGLKRVYSDLV